MALSSKVRTSIRPDGQKCLVAKASIVKNEILITYDGPAIHHPTRYSIQIDDHKHIEGTPESNAYLNHSCAPNAYVDWRGVYLRALLNIEPEDEITCNYLTTDWELHEKFVCHCGAPHCYGEVKGLKYLDHGEQRKLLPFLPDFMKRKVFAAEQETL
jgi:SET domain